MTDEQKKKVLEDYKYTHLLSDLDPEEQFLKFLDDIQRRVHNQEQESFQKNDSDKESPLRIDDNSNIFGIVESKDLEG